MAITGLEEARLSAHFEKRLNEIRAEGAAAERNRIRRELLAEIGRISDYSPEFPACEYRQGLENGNERAVDRLTAALDRICPEEG